MKTNQFFFGLFACAALCACSNDESGIVPGSPNVFTGDEAYISVRLSDAASLSRATTTDPGYEYGDADEHKVQNAYFYFYDANGVFVSEGSAWNGGTPNDATPVENIEFKGNTVVVLKGLTQKNYPKYMVTVLNRPDGLQAPDGSVPTTLDEMEKKLSSDAGVGITMDGNFVMSTTSWSRNGLDGVTAPMKYFVTEVSADNFSVEPVDLDDESNNPVKVYVERLAAKVTVDVSGDLPFTEIGDRKLYEVRATVAGENNDADINNPEGEDQMAAEKLYVEILGWKLNATAKHSRLVKNIDETWDNTADGPLGFVWNKPTDFRSFWGKSFNYGDPFYAYPTTAVGYDAKDITCPLDYFNLNSVLTLGSNAYCAENTNTSDIVTANYPSAVTSVLLKAMVCDAEGNPLDLVRFNGLLFKRSSFVEYILNVMKAKNQWNVWVETTTQGASEKSYAQIGTDYVNLVNVGDGKVKVELAVPAGTTLYARSGTEGNYTYSLLTDFSVINDDLKKESAGAIGYNGGLMYYNIPIEHLNNTAIAEGVIPEAKYGVVRNHHYVIRINKLENLGKGIFDPDEVIVPDPVDEGDTYYVGANIDILSWKIVSQSVEL